MRILQIRPLSRAIPAVIGLFCLTLTGAAQERDRSKISDRYKWNLADIYPSDAAWRSAKEKLGAELPELRQYQGKLASSAATLAEALEQMSALDKELSRLYVYANLLADQDTRDAQHQGMQQEMVQMAAGFGAQASYIEPEILRIDKAALEKFIASEPRLKVYRRRLHRARMELHPAFLPGLLRLPVRDLVHRIVGPGREGEGGRRAGQEALPGVSQRGWVEISDRSAEGRGRRHDHGRTVRADDEEENQVMDEMEKLLARTTTAPARPR